MKGIFVYGGCVTRDSFEYLKSDYTLTEYVARQSLISAGHPRVKVSEKAVLLASSFQQRQLRGDVESNFFPKLRESASKSDVLILDLIVERFGVRRYGQGYLTRSNELAKSALGRSLTASNASVRFATKRHLDLWKYSARKLIDVLNHESALDRVVVFDTPWASKTRAGTAVPRFRSHTSEEMNELYKPYYAYLGELGMRVERFPDELVVSDDDHKWGSAPYHYVPEAYEWMSSVIRSVPSRPAPQSQ